MELNEYHLDQEDIDALRKLRGRGCAVTVFLPQEMPASASDDVEDAMCEGGWDQINFDNERIDHEHNSTQASAASIQQRHDPA